MRGKDKTTGGASKSIGITPAYAGKRLSLLALSPFCQGSPPPMRGKVWSRVIEIGHIRITPAYAGKSPMGDTPIPHT